MCLQPVVKFFHWNFGSTLADHHWQEVVSKSLNLKKPRNQAKNPETKLPSPWRGNLWRIVARFPQNYGKWLLCYDQVEVFTRHIEKKFLFLFALDQKKKNRPSRWGEFFKMCEHLVEIVQKFRYSCILFMQKNNWPRSSEMITIILVTGNISKRWSTFTPSHSRANGVIEELPFPSWGGPASVYKGQPPWPPDIQFLSSHSFKLESDQSTSISI